jgi:predicted dehydrogenase
MDVLRVGVIGLGVGRSHIAGYRANLNSKINGLCDSNLVRLTQIGEEFTVPVEARYTDYQLMLDEASLDLVSVCVPNALHAEISIAALEAGAHVLVEKPMASSVEQAQAMLDAASRTGRRLMVTYNYRYRADSQWIRRMVQAGQLGDIYHAQASWRRETGIPGWGVFGSKDLSGGGALIDLGVHVLDLALWMMDFPTITTVSGDTRSLFGPGGLKTWGRSPGRVAEGEFNVEDGGFGFMRLANGASLNLYATWAEHNTPRQDDIRLELYGTKGTAILNISRYGKEDTVRFYTEIEGVSATVIPSIQWGEGVQGHAALISDIIDAVANDRPSPTSGDQGYAAVRALAALYESARLGREVALES